MNVSPLEIALIGGGFTILGALIGLIGADKLANRNAKRDAGRRLREAFAPELAALDPKVEKKDIDIETLLQTAFPKHHIAVIEFRSYLRGEKLNRFERAWKEYYEVGGSVRFFDYYMGEKPHECFQTRVNNILKFTDT